MFTGIIQAIGEIRRIEPRGGDLRLEVDTGDLALDDVARGDSIAVNGACLTAVELMPGRFAADVSRETLTVTTLGSLSTGDRVNLEKSLTLSTPLGGHLVSGHVDGIGQVIERRDDARSVRLAFEAPTALARYIAAKGSICIDGTSLTVNTVAGTGFEVNLVPHTLGATIATGYRPGTRVNLEVDLLARYVERLLSGDHASGDEAGGITEAFLARYGFLT